MNLKLHVRQERPSPPFPWEVSHAAPEDRAVGLELELIDLVARRNAIRDASDPEASRLDDDIEILFGELGDVMTVLPTAV